MTIASFREFKQNASKGEKSKLVSKIEKEIKIILSMEANSLGSTEMLNFIYLVSNISSNLPKEPCNLTMQYLYEMAPNSSLYKLMKLPIPAQELIASISEIFHSQYVTEEKSKRQDFNFS
ncbi:MAG: hypothetical protein JSR33_07460 [Proteobacteria bacterium]|nr:hypothetical protein [Pseudomonadota bacterium]